MGSRCVGSGSHGSHGRRYHAIGIVGAKNEQNVGTLWRSAFQLGAAFIFTVGTRYRSQTTDTLKSHWRMVHAANSNTWRGGREGAWGDDWGGAA